MKFEKLEVLITKRFPDKITAALEEVAVVHQWGGHPHDLMPREEVLKIIDRLSAVINQAELKVDEELLTRGHRLKIIANVSLGADNLNLDLMTKRGVWATNTPGSFDYPVAEYVIGGIITILRRLLEADRFVRNGEWQSFQPGFWDGESLRGKTLGIIGMGCIGRSLAQLGTCLGMKVIYHNRSKGSAPEYLWVPIAELLSRADVVSLHVPYSTETHELIAASQFEMMKPGVVFINTSRGKVVNESDLVKFLESKQIGGAVMDVFSAEPRVPEALKTMRNVLLTPHLAGGTKSGRLDSYKLAVDNVVAVLSGKQPLSPLNQL